MVTGDGKGGVVEGIRLDEGPVEVDAEHWQSGSLNCGGRERQKCPFLRLTRIWNQVQRFCVAGRQRRRLGD